MRPILIIKTGDSFAEVNQNFGDFESLIANGLQLEQDQLVIYDPRGESPLPNPDEFDGVVISGSHAMVTDLLPWSEKLVPYIQQLQQISKPLLGICYGHQLIAHALNGQAGFHNNGPEIGTVEITLTEQAKDDLLFSDLPQQFPVHVTHAQTALKLPENAVLLAANDFEPHQVYRVGDCIWGVQFHPEFTAGVTRIYAEKQREVIEKNNVSAIAVFESIKEAPICNLVLKKFTEFCRS